MVFSLASVDMFYMDIEDYVAQYNENHDEPLEYDYIPAKDNSLLIDLIPVFLLIAVGIFSSILAWEIPWTEEPGRLQSMGLGTVRHD